MLGEKWQSLASSFSLSKDEILEVKRQVSTSQEQLAFQMMKIEVAKEGSTYVWSPLWQTESHTTISASFCPTSVNFYKNCYGLVLSFNVISITITIIHANEGLSFSVL